MPHEVGHTADVGWQVGVSRTLDADLETVWAVLTSREGTAVWLDLDTAVAPEAGSRFETPDGLRGETRSWRRHDRIRLAWQPPDSDHETTVQVVLREGGGGRTRIRFHQERMTSAAERARQREHWTGVIDRLQALVETH